jgi:hypothetical protein
MSEYQYYEFAAIDGAISDEGMRQRADTLWSGLDLLMDQKIASACDQAAAQLGELRDAYAKAGDIGGFQQKLNGFRLRYSNRQAMLRRIEKLA